MSFLDKLLNKRYAWSVMEQNDLFNFNAFEVGRNSSFFDLQAFNQKSYSIQTDKQLQKSLAGHEKALEKHLNYLSAPEAYAKDWADRNEMARRGLINFWEKEVTNQRNQIQYILEEIKRRKNQ